MSEQRHPTSNAQGMRAVAEATVSNSPRRSLQVFGFDSVELEQSLHRQRPRAVNRPVMSAARTALVIVVFSTVVRRSRAQRAFAGSLSCTSRTDLVRAISTQGHVYTTTTVCGLLSVAAASGVEAVKTWTV